MIRVKKSNSICRVKEEVQNNNAEQNILKRKCAFGLTLEKLATKADSNYLQFDFTMNASINYT
jgi:hypothetical protein